MNMHKNSKNGFSLIELIVVMGIMAIIILIAVPKFIGYTKKARHTKIMSSVKEIESAADRYYIKNNDWPRATSEDDYYTKEELESYAHEIYDKTGVIIDLDENGHYYDIDYITLKNYVRVPDESVKYIIQNPIGRVYYLDKLTSKGEEIFNQKDLSLNDKNDSVINKPEYLENIKDEKVTVLDKVQKYPIPKDLIYLDYAISISNLNYGNILTINKQADITKYIVYRSLEPIINYEDSYVYDIIDVSNTGENITFSYTDTTHLYKTYYYKVIGISESNLYVSNEVSVSYPDTITYPITIRNDRIKYKNLTKNWYVDNFTHYIKTDNKEESVDISFIGTGIDINFYTTTSQTNEIVIYLNDVYLKTITNNSSVDIGTNNYTPIINGLPHAEHKLKIVNKDSASLQIYNIKVFINKNNFKEELNISGSTPNNKNTLSIDYIGGDTYKVYRSEIEGLSIDKMDLIEVIDKDLRYLNTTNKITYIDKTHLFKPYYYKVVAIDSTGKQIISNEVKLSYNEQIIYNLYIQNDRLSYKNLTKNWYLGHSYGYIQSTIKEDSVEIPFIGTGIDINFNTMANYSNNIDIYLNDVYLKTITNNSSVDFGTNNYTPIINGLSHAEHKLKIVNKDSATLQIYNIKAYTSYNSKKELRISGSTPNNKNTLTIDYIGGDTYKVYRSEIEGLSIDKMDLIEVIDKDLRYLNTTNKITYTDKTHLFKPYYYKVVAIDYNGKQIISNEIKLAYPDSLTYSLLIQNNRLKYKNQVGSWYNASNYIHSSGAGQSVEIPFIGTGIEIDFNNNFNATSVEVYLDNVLIKTLSSNDIDKTNKYIKILDNLEHKEHTLKIINKSGGVIELYNIKAYTK